MQKFCRKLLSGREKITDRPSKNSQWNAVGDCSSGDSASSAVSRDPDQKDEREQEEDEVASDLTLVKSADLSTDLGDKLKLKKNNKKKSRRQPLDPYVPAYAVSPKTTKTTTTATNKQSSSHRFSCQCGCNCNGQEEWRLDRVKLSKCAGVMPSILAAGLGATEVESDEEAEVREVQHRRSKQWFHYQLANGTESHGYRLSPR